MMMIQIKGLGNPTTKSPACFARTATEIAWVGFIQRIGLFLQ